MNFNKAEFILSATVPRQFVRDGLPQIAFAGRSNVGKSSVINRLLGLKNFARVGAAPGKTSQINYFKIDSRAYLVDLPGYGYAKTSKPEQERLKKLIFGYLESERDLRLAIQLVDMRHAPSADDLTMINALIDAEIPFIIVFTKADKLNKTEREKRMLGFAGEIPCYEDIHTIAFSAKTFEGQEELRALLSDIAEEIDEDTSEEEE